MQNGQTTPQKANGTSFKPGYDPRRPQAGPRTRILDSGKTLPQLAREFTEEALGYVVCVLTNTNKEGDPQSYDDKLRLRAAEIVMDRGWGRAPAYVQLGVNQEQGSPQDMTLGELLAYANKERDLIEGELDSMANNGNGEAILSDQDQ